MNKNLIFISIVIFSYLYEKSEIKCKNLNFKTEFLSIVHHILTNYMYFGSFIYGYYSEHLILHLVVMLWRGIMKRQGASDSCFFSEEYVRMCGFDKHEKFRDIPHLLVRKADIGLKYYMITTIIVAYDIHNILKA